MYLAFNPDTELGRLILEGYLALPNDMVVPLNHANLAKTAARNMKQRLVSVANVWDRVCINHEKLCDALFTQPCSNSHGKSTGNTFVPHNELGELIMKGTVAMPRDMQVLDCHQKSAAVARRRRLEVMQLTVKELLCLDCCGDGCGNDDNDGSEGGTDTVISKTVKALTSTASSTEVGTPFDPCQHSACIMGRTCLIDPRLLFDPYTELGHAILTGASPFIPALFVRPEHRALASAVARRVTLRVDANMNPVFNPDSQLGLRFLRGELQLPSCMIVPPQHQQLVDSVTSSKNKHNIVTLGDSKVFDPSSTIGRLILAGWLTPPKNMSIPVAHRTQVNKALALHLTRKAAVGKYHRDFARVHCQSIMELYDIAQPQQLFDSILKAISGGILYRGRLPGHGECKSQSH